MLLADTNLIHSCGGNKDVRTGIWHMILFFSICLIFHPIISPCVFTVGVTSPGECGATHGDDDQEQPMLKRQGRQILPRNRTYHISHRNLSISIVFRLHAYNLRHSSKHQIHVVAFFSASFQPKIHKCNFSLACPVSLYHITVLSVIIKSPGGVLIRPSKYVYINEQYAHAWSTWQHGKIRRATDVRGALYPRHRKNYDLGLK